MPCFQNSYGGLPSPALGTSKHCLGGPRKREWLQIFPGSSVTRGKQFQISPCIGHLNRISNNGLHIFQRGDQWHEKANTRDSKLKCRTVGYASCIVSISNCKPAEAEIHSVPELVDRSSFSWSAKITRFVKERKHVKALECLQLMNYSIPDIYTIASLLKACSALGFLEKGRCIHALAVQSGWDSIVFVKSCLIDMYAKCGSIEDAQCVFNDISVHNIVTWSTMMAGYVKCGHSEKTLDLFQQMQKEHIEPNGFAYVSVLNACVHLVALQEGRSLHAMVVQSRLDSNVFVASSLVDMYAKCNSIEDACKVFEGISEPNIVTWNTMIKGYTTCKEGWKALQLFHWMQLAQVKPDAVTIVSVLNACSLSGTLDEGILLHACILRNGMESNLFVCNCLIDMYIRCGSIEDAYRVFSHMPVRDAVSWTSMISGYENSGQGKDALHLFYKMLQYENNPNSATFVSVLKACASMTALADGKYIHAQAIQRGYGLDLAVQNCLIYMYTKCGSIQDACRVFRAMTKHDILSWNAMIMAYAIHGICKGALQIFDHMWKHNVHVDTGTFVALLSVFSHTGLVDPGYYYLESMTALYEVSPTVQRYNCLIVTLGRSGHIQDALDIIKNMEYEPDVCVWISLLGACRIHDDVQLEVYAAKKILGYGYLDRIDQPEILANIEEVGCFRKS